MSWLRLYSRIMIFWMLKIVGIKLEVRGKHFVPTGACIIAAKHQSWGDGYSMFSQFHDLAFVAGDHLEKIPFVGWILKKMDAVVVAQCGGAESRKSMMDKEMARARENARRIFIYPEGRLTEVGYYAPYKKGVYHMYESFNCPVVPVSTNLGLFWPQDKWNLKAGNAVLEFHEPIQPGLSKVDFMHQLEEIIESGSLALLPEGFELPKERKIVVAET